MSTWTDLPAMAKIEVVVDGDDVPAVRDLFLDAGATGYTAVSGVSGFGHHGHHQGRLLFNDRASLSMLITVVPIASRAACVTRTSLMSMTSFQSANAW